MIKDTIAANEAVTPNSREMAVLKDTFPSCFHADGSFDIERFKEFLSNKVSVVNEGYELRFLGKNYARLLASLDTTTVVVPDEAHNAKPENANSENVYISGDNLDGLKHLLKSYARRVKCIYIDPPYNTGSDGFVYNDSFDFTAEELASKLSIDEDQAQRVLDLTKRGSASHSAWLLFMYPRLLLARDLLGKDGVLFISIDENEHSNLQLLCNDVFDEENFAGEIVWKNSSKNDQDFETEKDNFCNRAFKIKTLALFFIDDITSYRTGDDRKEPYLKEAFERLLKEQIERTLAELDEHDAEYRAFLEASLADISACHAGYFAQDNSDSDEEIAKEVDTILHGKKQLLSFRNKDGSYNTLRFLFSKWTLKEGWDNPNVFTIAKLRSSGSENSKLQEVGRGLRLPVDENGNRIANETFNLNYIVDFTEADFAEQLVKQINAEIPQTASISEEKLQAVAKKLGVSADDLFDTLYVEKRYIDRHRNIKPETREAFFAEYPDFASGLSSGRVTDRNKDKPKPIKIRKAAYAEIKELWEKINQRYILYYDSDINNDLDTALLTILEDGDIFRDVTMVSSRDIVHSDGAQMSVEAGTGVRYTVSHPIPYNVFLRRIMQATSVPIAQMHGAIRRYVQKHGPVAAEKFNDNSAVAFAAAFQEWRNTRLQGRFHYAKAGSPVSATALSNADGTPRLEITQGRIGTKIVPGTPSDKYLYDTFAFDSPLEKKNLLEEIDSVIVYGKIPRRSIAIPVITGGTYSPDFMYVVKKKSGEKELNIVVETKDVENRTDLRGEELVKISCAKVFFDMLSLDGYKVYFRDQLRNKEIKQIIEDVMACDERADY